MHSVCRCSLPVWKRSLLKKGTPGDLFWPCPGSAPGGSGRKTTTLVRDHEYFILTKFHQNPSSGSGEEVENVKSLRQTDGRTTTTDNGRTARYDNSSLEPSIKKVMMKFLNVRQISNVNKVKNSQKGLVKRNPQVKYQISTKKLVKLSNNNFY